MIKVLRHGIMNKVTCPICGTKLQYDKEDVLEETFSVNPDYCPSGFKTHYYIICPDCCNRIRVKFFI